MSENEEKVPVRKNGKALLIACLVLSLIAAFVLGWRVMPKVWPSVKGLFAGQPQATATAAPTPEPYVPRSTAAFEDEVRETDSLIYYFYKDYCPYCRELEPLTAGLPKTITLPDGTQSAVRFVCLNKVEEGPAKVIADYYAAHSVPEDRQYVPALVIGDRYLFLKEEIVGQLTDALTAGEGLNTPLLNGAQRVPAP